jgi:hypothetical protein
MGLIGVNEAVLLERDNFLGRKVIMVDDFAPEELGSETIGDSCQTVTSAATHLL